MKKIIFVMAMIMLICCFVDAGEIFQISKGNNALTDVVISESPTARTKQAAQDLAQYLSKITGNQFKVVTGDGKNGIAVGRFDDFPSLKLKEKPDPKDMTKRELYVLRSHKNGIYVIGATDIAVEDAVWEFLYQIGYRQFFPPAKWEYIPKQKDLSINIDRVEVPDYYARRIWYGYGTWSENKPLYDNWCKKNRAVSSITLNTGHAYDHIISKNKAEFEKHPEYLGLIKGERKSSKFCISNPGLRKLVVDYAIKSFEQNPDADSISMEPSDGGGWCECEECQKMGSISDRALTLANEVADAVSKKFGQKYVGMYAYAYHSPPPNIKVHPNVIISVATAFIKGGYTVDQLMEGWSKKGATIGIREYYGVNVWDRDLPGSPKASGPRSLAQSIADFHKKGARFLSAESSDNWGPNGPGYYIAARVLWDVDEAKRVDELRKDFFEKMFGPAKDKMEEFYNLIDRDNRPLLTEDLIGRMYRTLDEAKKKTNDPMIQSRINDLVLYTRYVELFKKYSATTKGDERQKAFEDVIRFAYRIKDTCMIHSLALYRDLPGRDKSVSVPEDAKWNVPEGKNIWKNSQPFTEEEIKKIIEEGIAGNKLIDFKPVSFSMKLVPATKLNISKDLPSDNPVFGTRGKNIYHIWVEKAPAEIKLKITGGLIYQDRGDVGVFLYPAEQEESKYVDQASVPPDKTEHIVTLKTTYQGLHYIEVSDRMAGTSVEFLDRIPLTVFTSFTQQPHFMGRWNFVFYVPVGTKVVGGYSTGQGTVLDSSGKKVYSLPGTQAYFSIPVEKGQDGKIWKIQQGSGVCVLMTVPSCFARNPWELMLPEEVVLKDSK